jgi:hypothetical protein
MAATYLIVFKALAPVVPSSLRQSVKQKIGDEFSSFDVELDFGGSKTIHDLVVTFLDEISGLPIYGESTRIGVTDASGTSLGVGRSTLYVRAMKTMRIQTAPGTCDAAFPETESALGTIIANCTIHEIGHMLGMQDGGYDDGGHTTDPDNYMWDPGSMPGGNTHVSPYFEYTVKTGDNLSTIVYRYNHGTLDACCVGNNDLTYQDVWSDPENKKMGFIAHPTKSGVPGRRVNNANYIYVGEKVALPSNNLRTPDYRRNFAGFLGKKTFTDAQIKIMRDFIAQRLLAGRG